MQSRRGRQAFEASRSRSGQPHVAEDVARLAAVRRELGPDFEIMVDANQCFTVSEAIRRAKGFEEFDLAWFEEPMPAEDIDGHVRLSQSTSLPIAVGEVAVPSIPFPRVSTARRLLYRPGRRRTHRRRHTVAENGSSRRNVQHANLSALSDGNSCRAVRGGSELRLGGVYSAA